MLSRGSGPASPATAEPPAIAAAARRARSAPRTWRPCSPRATFRGAADGILVTVRRSKTNQVGETNDVRYLKNGIERRVTAHSGMEGAQKRGCTGSTSLVIADYRLRPDPSIERHPRHPLNSQDERCCP